MKKKILMLDNDEPTVRMITHIGRIFGLDTLVIHNWGKSLNLIQNEDIVAVFLNVELGIVNIPSFLKQFPQDKEKIEGHFIPVYFLFNKMFSPQFQKAKNFPHAGDLKKPVKLEMVAQILNQICDIDQTLTYVEEKYRAKWKEIKSYLVKTDGFMEQLESILE